MTQVTCPSTATFNQYESQPSKAAKFCNLSAKGIKTALKSSVAALGVILTYGAVIAAVGVSFAFIPKADLSTLFKDFIITTITGAGVATIATFKNPVALFKYYYDGLGSLFESQKSPVSSTPPSSEASFIKATAPAQEKPIQNIHVNVYTGRVGKKNSFNANSYAPALGTSYGPNKRVGRFKLKSFDLG